MGLPVHSTFRDHHGVHNKDVGQTEAFSSNVIMDFCFAIDYDSGLHMPKRPDLGIFGRETSEVFARHATTSTTRSLRRLFVSSRVRPKAVVTDAVG